MVVRDAKSLLASGRLKRARLVGLALLAALGVGSCGLQPREQRAAWRGQAEAACYKTGAVRFTAFMKPRAPIDGPGVCGLDKPLTVSALADGTVSLSSPNTLGCPMVAAVEGWLADTVQPAAEALYGQRVVGLRSGSFACRSRNNQRGAQLSEHSFGNALDVFSFTFADGRQVKVASGWRGAPEEQRFLREVFVGACATFTTVLGPGADAFHYDHFHFDLARHDAAGRRRVCKPIIKYEPLVASAPPLASPGLRSAGGLSAALPGLLAASPSPREPQFSRPPVRQAFQTPAPLPAGPALRPNGLPPRAAPGDVIEDPDEDMIDADVPDAIGPLY